MEQGKIKLTWEQGVADRIRAQAAEKKSSSPYMVSIIGIPGSGKTTSSSVLQNTLSDLGCLLMPFDGYHYPKAALEKFPDSEDVIYRRGAPDTFDAQALCQDLERLRHGNEPVISLPGFDHAKGDPEEGAHVFRRDDHQIVICEGLYLLHNEGGWDEVADYFDFSVFVDANIDVCMERLKVRNRVIPGYSAEEVASRVDAVDRSNALVVQKSKIRADLIVQAATT